MKKKLILLIMVVVAVFLFNIDMNNGRNLNTTNSIELNDDVVDDNNYDNKDIDEKDIKLVETNKTNSSPKVVETQKEAVIKEEPREVEIECAYIPQSDKDFCHTDSIYQVEPGEEIEEYFKKTAEEIKKDLLVDQGGEFCKTEKITGGYKIYFCNKTGKKIEEVTVMDRGIDSDGIRYLDAVKYKYLDF